MKLHHALTLLLSTLTVLSFASQEGSSRTRATSRPTQRQDGAKTTTNAPDQAGQDLPGAIPETTLDVFGRRRQSSESKSPQELLIGGWALESMKLRKGPTSSQGASGLLVVGQNFLSLELHGSGDPTSRTNGLAFHMSLGGEYVLTPGGALSLRTVIGSFQDTNSDQLAWEGTGKTREFKAVFSERQLALSWGGGANQLLFSRRTPTMSGRIDIFGRRIQPSADAPSEATDIFGRGLPEELGGEKDIFGRPVPNSESGKTGTVKAGGDRRR
jgi:hypothetical protein